MSIMSRRDAGKLIAGAGAALALGRRGLQSPRLEAAARIDSVVKGVQIGAQSYSFRDRPLDAAIDAYREVGLGECELYAGHVEPNEDRTKREALREWRLTTPLSHFHEVRQKFDNAGILLFAYNYSFRKDFTDAEIERGFQMAQAMGLTHITASANVSVAPRVDQYAQQYKIMVGFHGHDQTSERDEFSSPETFARAMHGTSEYIGVNLDIGHFTAAGYDPVEYLRAHHDRIVTLHIKDRKKDHGPNEPFGQGETNIAGVLRLLRDEHWAIPANIEYEYNEEIKGLDTVAEMKKCYAYCKQALEA